MSTFLKAIPLNHMRGCVLIVGLWLSASAVHASFTTYTGTELESLGGPSSYVYAINAIGQVVGYSDTSGDVGMHAALWQPGTTKPTDLGSGFASSINDTGQVVGTAYAGGERAALWQPGATTPTVFNTAGVIASAPYGVNAIGQVVGYASTRGNFNQAALWQPGTAVPTYLGTLGGSSYAIGINDSGQMAGQAQIKSGDDHAALWQAGATSPVDLGTFQGGTRSYAIDINARGHVVGSAYTSGGAEHAALWQPGSTTPTDLGTLGGTNSIALDINTSGQVVGRSDNSGNSARHAAIWLNGSTTPVDLTTLVILSSGYLFEARGINDSGQIIANAVNGKAYLLTPNITSVPIPTAVWLFSSSQYGLVLFIRKLKVVPPI